MNDIGTQLLLELRASLPGSSVYWEIEPTPCGFRGSVLTAQHKDMKFTMQFEKSAEDASVEALDASFIEQVINDFTDYFDRSIYPKKKFTRLI